jgi:hypothetical protein
MSSEITLGTSRLPSATSSVGADADARVRPSGKRPSVREATLDDHGQIAALQIRNGLSPKSYDDWTALWCRNPIYQQWEGQWPIGWVLESESHDIVGWVGNIPSAYQFRGRRLSAATPWSWVVDVQYRGHGLLILNRFLRQKDVDLLVSSSVSSASEPFTRYLRFSRVPTGTWHKSAFWITNHRGFAQIALRMKAGPLALAMAWPLSAALTCWDWRNDGWTQVGSAKSKVELCTQFDIRFDVFWEELQRQNENVLLAERTQQNLAWHFRETLSQQRAWILAISEAQRLTAYAIFDRQDNPTIGLRRVRLVDFQALKGSEDALLSTVSWMLQKCLEQGVHVLEVDGCWLTRPGLPRINAPYRRAMPSWRFYYKACEPRLGEALKGPEVWAPSSFDGDASL